MENSHLKGLHQKLWVVLIALVALTLATTVMLQQIIDGNENTGKLVNLSGKQRMLSQRVVMLASRLRLVEPAEQPAIQRQLTIAVTSMEDNHRALVYGDPLQGIPAPPPPKAMSLLFGPDGNLDQQIKSFLLTAREVANPPNTSLSQEEQRVTFLYHNAFQILLKNLDRMVTIYQQEGEQNVQWVKTGHLLTTLLTLVVLAISWLVLITPALKSLRTALAELLRQQAEIRKLSQATDQSPAGVVITDAQGVVEYVNPHFSKMSGYLPAEIIGSKSNILQSGTPSPTVYQELWRTILAGKDWQGTFLNKKKSGELYHDHTTIRPITDDTGTIVNLLAIKQDISEQLRLEQALREATAQAEMANQAKSEFVANMSHELRTPLNAILGFAQLLVEDPINPLNPEQMEYTTHILKGGQHLLGLINEILELSRIESGKLTVSMENINLQDVVAACLPFCQTQAKRQGITIYNNCGSLGQVLIFADFIRLKQVLLNLLSNAIKYNREGGHIILEAAETSDNQVRVSVRDNGPGISLDKQRDLFKPFQRLGAELSDIEGSGIGLTIAQRLVELMAGTLGFTSTPGEGSTFWVSFPKTPSLVIPDTSNPQRIQQLPWQQLLTLSGGAILYVEDNPANLRLLEKSLAKVVNFTFLSAHNGELGLAMVAIHRPVLIILDINLPGKNGYQLLETLRADAQTSHIPVIALTSHARQEDERRGMAAGFNAYLTKPVSLELLYHTIYQILHPSNQKK